MVLGWIIGATVLVSLISLVGISLFLLGKKKVESVLFYIVSFSAGTLLGAAFFDLLPESVEAVDATLAFEVVFLGIVSAFVVEKFIHWHHHHAASEKEHHHPLGMLTLVGDGIHNFLDGVAIAAAFIVSVPLGITTTVAIALHEIPQEIGDFGLLLYSGYSRGKALLFNFISALTAIAGGVLFWLFSDAVAGIEGYALAFTAGTFIYISAVDLIPEIHKEKNARRSLAQLALLLLGAATIWLVARVLGG